MEAAGPHVTLAANKTPRDCLRTWHVPFFAYISRSQSKKSWASGNDNPTLIQQWYGYGAHRWASKLVWCKSHSASPAQNDVTLVCAFIATCQSYSPRRSQRNNLVFHAQVDELYALRSDAGDAAFSMT